ncbi:hypothetical protein EVAR_102232_1 [Eumeta japonica]|uniref:Uncharacterized protein n=1 Tax=Eumeta variegata TaxID=151549 RepID=A0A4C1WFX1_EUMVA|nr:hypothetical protein EVAR_102232_1 [Eumeta japonica]
MATIRNSAGKRKRSPGPPAAPPAPPSPHARAGTEPRPPLSRKNLPKYLSKHMHCSLNGCIRHTRAQAPTNTQTHTNTHKVTCARGHVHLVLRAPLRNGGVCNDKGRPATPKGVQPLAYCYKNQYILVRVKATCYDVADEFPLQVAPVDTEYIPSSSTSADFPLNFDSDHSPVIDVNSLSIVRSDPGSVMPITVLMLILILLGHRWHVYPPVLNAVVVSIPSASNVRSALKDGGELQGEAFSSDVKCQSKLHLQGAERVQITLRVCEGMGITPSPEDPLLAKGD